MLDNTCAVTDVQHLQGRAVSQFSILGPFLYSRQISVRPLSLRGIITAHSCAEFIK